MEQIKAFLMEQGFDEARIEEYVSLDDCCLDSCAELYAEHLGLMREEFDDWFVLQMFSMYTGVFMRTDFAQQLEAVRRQFDTDMWATLIQYEWSQTGESAVFGLMDDLSVGGFEAGLKEVCANARSLWVQDYGEDDL